MGEYKTITVTNVSLPEDKWQYVIRCLNNLGKFVQLEHGKIAYLGGKSTIKVKYSIDCGAVTTEYGAFRLAVDFYIGPHLSGVRIEEMNYSWRRKNRARSLLPGNRTLYCADVPLTRMYTAKWGSREKRKCRAWRASRSSTQLIRVKVVIMEGYGGKSAAVEGYPPVNRYNK